jgi:hypothetical protein
VSKFRKRLDAQIEYSRAFNEAVWTGLPRNTPVSVELSAIVAEEAPADVLLENLLKIRRLLAGNIRTGV